MTVIIPPPEQKEEKNGRFREKLVRVKRINHYSTLPCPECYESLKSPYRCDNCRVELAFILEN